MCTWLWIETLKHNSSEICIQAKRVKRWPRKRRKISKNSSAVSNKKDLGRYLSLCGALPSRKIKKKFSQQCEGTKTRPYPGRKAHMRKRDRRLILGRVHCTTCEPVDLLRLAASRVCLWVLCAGWPGLARAARIDDRFAWGHLSRLWTTFIRCRLRGHPETKIAPFIWYYTKYVWRRTHFFRQG